MVPLATPMGGQGLQLAVVGTADRCTLLYIALHDLLCKNLNLATKIATTKTLNAAYTYVSIIPLIQQWLVTSW